MDGMDGMEWDPEYYGEDFYTEWEPEFLPGCPACPPARLPGCPAALVPSERCLT